MFDWNDLRYFLFVARDGSTSAAARRLSVNQTTVARRIAMLETTLGSALFERHRSGHILTETGRAMLDAAERVEQSALDVEHAIRARARRVDGSIRVTANEMMANILVAPYVAQFNEAHPEVGVELVVEERRLDISRGEADIAIRAGSRPTDPTLVARRLMDLAWAPYVSVAYADRNGCPSSAEEISDHVVIGAEKELAALPAAKWLNATAPDATIICRCNKLTNQLATVQAGLGLAVLPCFVGDEDPLLKRCIGPIQELFSECWVIVPESLRAVERTSLFVEGLAEYMNARRALLTGNSVIA